MGTVNLLKITYACFIIETKTKTTGDIKFSVHDRYLKQPSSGTPTIKRLQSQKM